MGAVFEYHIFLEQQAALAREMRRQPSRMVDNAVAGVGAVIF
jgi:hypothetical protein